MAIWFQLESPLIEIDCPIVLSSVMKHLAQISMRGERQRIEFQCAPGLGNRSIRLSVEEQIERVPLMGLWVIWVELDCALEGRFGFLPLKEVHVGMGQ